MKTVGIIADIVDSRSIPQRDSFQRKLHEVLLEVNERSAETILSPHTITIGDEFQALYDGFTRVLRDIVHLAWRLHPVAIRVALSYDKLSTDINRSAAVGMDGPVFHRARAILDRLKSHGSTVIQVVSGFENEELVNASLMLLSDGLGTWSATTIGTLAGMLEGLDVKETGPHLGVTKRAVYKVISTHRLEHHLALIEAMTTVLERERRQDRSA